MATSSQSRLMPSACIFIVMLLLNLSFFKQKKFCLHPCQWVLHLNVIEQYFIRITLLKNKAKTGKMPELTCVEFWEFL